MHSDHSSHILTTKTSFSVCSECVCIKFSQCNQLQTKKNKPTVLYPPCAHALCNVMWFLPLKGRIYSHPLILDLPGKFLWPLESAEVMSISEPKHQELLSFRPLLLQCEQAELAEFREDPRPS